MTGRASSFGRLPDSPRNNVRIKVSLPSILGKKSRALFLGNTWYKPFWA